MIRRALHEQTQHFVHSVMGGPTRKAVKYDKKALKPCLMQLRNMAADWSDGLAIMDEDAMRSQQGQTARLGSAPARLLRLLRTRLVAPCSLALPGRGPGPSDPGHGLSCSS